MRVLWCCNVVLPQIAEATGISDVGHSAGWIEGFLHGIKNQKDIKLGIICPHQKRTSGAFEGIKFWTGPLDVYRSAIEDFNPDILHVFGTENEEAKDVIRLFNRPDRTVINIQGMLRLYGEVYTDGLPLNLQRKKRLFESLVKNSIIDQKQNLLKRSVAEKDSLTHVKHVIGRTDIDKMFAMTANPNVNYHFCNEILRKEFYDSPKWDISKIKRHSIMMRNTGNPIKGLYHVMLALPSILKRYPDAHLYVVGSSYTIPKNIKHKFTEGSYNRLLRKTAEKYQLEKHITPLGALDADEMRQLYLQSHVVVSASVIENESNVVSEAKILGVPVVASYVGGLMNRLTHSYDGFLYPFNMPEMIAHYVTTIFEDDNLSVNISANSIESQTKINDPDTNILQLIKIYREILT